MDMIRLAYESGLVENVSGYKLFRDCRNITSHTYDTKKADKVMAALDPFVKEMRIVLKAIQKRNK